MQSMKVIYRPFVFIFMGLAFVSLVVPSAAFAQGEQLRNNPQKPVTDKSSKQVTAQNSQAACANITGLSTRLSGQVDEKRTKIDQSATTRNEKRVERQEQQNQKLTDKRGEWDKKRQDNFAKLREKASTDEQKAAVEAYVEAVSAAIELRRTSIDTANQVFKDATTASISEFKANRQADAMVLRSAIQAAVEKAIANCPTQGKQAIETMKSEIKTAREIYKNNKGANTLKGVIQSAQEVRKTSLKEATTTFKEMMAAAREDLKLVLPIAE